MADTRPGGRTARTRAAVHTAVRELFAEGHDQPSVREVSERSGVHEVTIYRRWGRIESLVLDVAVTQLNEDAPFPDSGDLRRDLLGWAHAVAGQVKTREGFALFHALAAATSPLAGGKPAPTADEAARYLRQRTAQMQRALDRVEAAGGKPPTVAHIFDVVLAPIYLRAVFGYESPDKDLDALVDQVLRTT
ncbi:TetR/AcrR family transcriptional regulator [Amycolatopsis oliviviridis]|uniref:TetR family transcriptional regulator n=1 Tax=Amycolatopsis oliviviridis TaxID=1471590 RepID=A0ABQ3L353_9PSEU|nr:TetR-like C-terminal domain-containing protein [Amycolatopsis oliviviridis]GHH01484.1 TetR family transcriptional regulator [Amycolatopsis oliviviridis]